MCADDRVGKGLRLPAYLNFVSVPSQYVTLIHEANANMNVQAKN